MPCLSRDGRNDHPTKQDDRSGMNNENDGKIGDLCDGGLVIRIRRYEIDPVGTTGKARRSP